MSRHDSVHRESLPSIGSIMNPPLLDIKRDVESQSSQSTTAPVASHAPPASSGPFRSSFTSEPPHNLPTSYSSPIDSRRTSDDRPGPFARPGGQTLPSVRDLIKDEKPLSNQESHGPFRSSQAPDQPSYHSEARFGTDPRAPAASSFAPPPPPVSYSSQSFSSAPPRPTSLPVSTLTQDSQLPAPVLHVNTKVEPNSQAYSSPGYPGSSGYGQPPVLAHISVAGYTQATSHPYSATMAPSTSTQMPPTTYIRSPPFSAPAQYSSSFDDGAVAARVEERIAMGRPAGSGMGESVKRRLDEFGIEHGIIEVQNLSRDILHFTQQYAEGKSVHPTNYPTAVVDSSLPSIHEINNMLDKSREILDSLARMRDFVLQESNARRETAHDPRYSTYAQQPANPGNNGYQVDAKDSNFGPEPKKTPWASCSSRTLSQL